MSGNHLIPNHQYKDRLFRFIFQDKRDLLSLYNAVNGSSYENPEDLEIHTLEDVMYLSMKNDISFLIDNRLNLYEEQSTWNPNMPLRGLFYFARLYHGYVAEHDLDVYSSTRVKLPFPQFVVFYIGQDRKMERRTLRLSDSFEKINDQTPCLVCTVQDFVAQGYALTQAISTAIDVCIRQGILDDFLVSHRAEVAEMIFSECNLEFHLNAMRKGAREEGRQEGRQEGERLINLLHAELLKQKRYDDLERSVSDPEFQKQLLAEFHIGEAEK